MNKGKLLRNAHNMLNSFIVQNKKIKRCIQNVEHYLMDAHGGTEHLGISLARAVEAWHRLYLQIGRAHV